MAKITDLFPVSKAEVIRRFFGDYNLQDQQQLRNLHQNLPRFRDQLNAEGVDDDDIEGIRFILTLLMQGKTHPAPGEFNPHSPEWRRMGGGWKIHLNAKLKHHFSIFIWLRENWTFHWKYLTGGEPEEKPFTIYVGSWDEMEVFARKIDKEIGDKLDGAKGDTLSMDINVIGKIYSRFEIKEWNEARNGPFHYRWSFLGAPLFRADALTIVGDQSLLAKYHSADRESIKPFWKRSVIELIRIFGAYFYGNQQQYVKRVKIEFS